MEKTKKTNFTKEKNTLMKCLMHVHMFDSIIARNIVEGLDFLSAHEVHAYNVALLGNFAEETSGELIDELIKRVPEAKEYLDEYFSFEHLRTEFAKLFLYKGKVSFSVQKDLYKTGLWFVKVALARYPYIDKGLFNLLVKENNEALWVRLATNQHITPQAVVELSHKKSESVFESLSKRIKKNKLSRECVLALCKEGNSKLLPILAKTSLDASVLDELLLKENEEITEAVLYNPNTPLRLLEVHYDNPALRDVIQSALLRRADGIRVLEQKICNSMPTSLLLAIAKNPRISDEGVAKLVELNNYSVLVALEGNTNLSGKSKACVLGAMGDFEVCR